jgi:eukaryotic-like serine/threonine-protein kinase
MAENSEAYRLLAPSGADDPSLVDPLVGRVIQDKFRILGLIARGGMGRVYRARQEPLGRMCAIKVVNAGFGSVDPEFQRRFFLEASVSSKLTHPNTVTVFDYGKTDDDMFYMAMELLEGQTLHRAIRQGRALSEVRAIHIARQICRSLREAHAMGVIHRDLKPANVFLVNHGDEPDFVKVLDFGLVKDITEKPEEQLTQTGLFMGSPKYMAPEQIEGRRVDGRTDVYAIGVILFEMLTGRVPFERATSVATLMAHVHEPPPLIRTLNPDVNPSLEAAVFKCMAKEQSERFDSVDELLNVLRSFDVPGQSGPHDAGHSARLLSTHPPGTLSDRPLEPAISSVLVRESGTGSAAAAIQRSGTADIAAVADTEPDLRRPASKLAIVLLLLASIGVGGGIGLSVYRYTEVRKVLPGSLLAQEHPDSVVSVQLPQPEPGPASTIASSASASAPSENSTARELAVVPMAASGAVPTSVSPSSSASVAHSSALPLPSLKGHAKPKSHPNSTGKDSLGAAVSSATAPSVPLASVSPSAAAAAPLPSGFKDSLD